MYSIREANQGDFDALNQLYLRCCQEAEWLPLAAKNKVDFARDTEGEVIWVAVDACARVVGFISVWMEDSFVHHLYIDSSMRGQGVGRALLAFLAGRVPFPLRLKCAQTNTRAEEFYRQLGWKRVEAGHNEDGDYWLLELRLEEV